jgi:hypothetical protein
LEILYIEEMITRYRDNVSRNYLNYIPLPRPFSTAAELLGMSRGGKFGCGRWCRWCVQVGAEGDDAPDVLELAEEDADGLVAVDVVPDSGNAIPKAPPISLILPMAFDHPIQLTGGLNEAERVGDAPT